MDPTAPNPNPVKLKLKLNAGPRLSQPQLNPLAPPSDLSRAGPSSFPLPSYAHAAPTAPSPAKRQRNMSFTPSPPPEHRQPAVRSSSSSQRILPSLASLLNPDESVTSSSSSYPPLLRPSHAEPYQPYQPEAPAYRSIQPSSSHVPPGPQYSPAPQFHQEQFSFPTHLPPPPTLQRQPPSSSYPYAQSSYPQQSPSSYPAPPQSSYAQDLPQDIPPPPLLPQHLSSSQHQTWTHPTYPAPPAPPSASSASSSHYAHSRSTSFNPQQQQRSSPAPSQTGSSTALSDRGDSPAPSTPVAGHDVPAHVTAGLSGRALIEARRKWRKKAGLEGPGKNWRKGLKKDQLATSESRPASPSTSAAGGSMHPEGSSINPNFTTHSPSPKPPLSSTHDTPQPASAAASSSASASASASAQPSLLASPYAYTPRALPPSRFHTGLLSTTPQTFLGGKSPNPGKEMRPRRWGWGRRPIKGVGGGVWSVGGWIGEGESALKAWLDGQGGGGGGGGGGTAMPSAAATTKVSKPSALSQSVVAPAAGGGTYGA